MPESRRSKEPMKPTADELLDRARHVHETLTRLLREINELLDKTKRLVKDEDSAGSG